MEVAMPVSPMEAPPIASCKAFLPAQTLVPSPWLEAPMERPMAMLFLIFKASKILWLKVAPSMPVKITQAAVSAGIPPIAEEISMAIGVVTDLGIMESSTWLLAPNILPQMKMLTMPVMVATRMPLIITGRFSFIMRLLLYSGRASATVAGPSRKLIKPAPVS